MRRFALMTVGVAGVFVAVGLLGCGAATTPADPSATEADSPDDGDGHHDEDGHHDGDGDHGDHASGDHAHGGHGDMEAGLAKLSDADRASAEKQHVCPVTGDMLGTAGAPIKLTVKGQDLWVCCDDCKKPVEADPDKYLAKLNK